MQVFHVLVDDRRRLRTAVAFHRIKVKRMDRELAKRALERDATVQRLGGVVTHNLIVVLYPRGYLGARGVGPSFDGIRASESLFRCAQCFFFLRSA